MVELLKDILHSVGIHKWYVSPRGAFMHGHRACVRCGIIEVKGALTKKWRRIE